MCRSPARWSRFHHTKKTDAFCSVMIEVNRQLYMDERTGQKRDDFETVRGTLGRLIVAAAEAAAHRRGRSFYRKWEAP
jgi:N-formylglutamate amidohydrolase